MKQNGKYSKIKDYVVYFKNIETNDTIGHVYCENEEIAKRYYERYSEAIKNAETENAITVVLEKIKKVSA